MNSYFKLCGAVLLAAVLAGCGSMSGVFSSDDSGDSASAETSEASESSAESNTFLASDDYKEDEEVVGVFLTDADYAKMTEDFSGNGAEFDWGWAAPGLDVHKYSSVRLTVKNDSSTLDPNIKDVVRESFTKALKRLGLKVVSSGSADLELALDIVDYNADSTYAFVTMIEPFIELELRLKNLSTGKDLLLIRDQEHASTPDAAAVDFAGSVMQFLR